MLDQSSGVTTSVPVNTTFTNKTLGTFRDQDSLNTSPGDYVGVINWGDGATSADRFVFVASTFNVGSYRRVQGSHKYVKITLHDTGSPGSISRSRRSSRWYRQDRKALTRKPNSCIRAM